MLDEAGWGADAWRRVLTDPAFADALHFTLRVAATSTAIAVIGALVVATWLRRTRWTRSALTLPVASPHLVLAALAVTWAAPGGIVDRIVGGTPVTIIGDRSGWGIIVVYAAKELPFVALVAIAALDDVTGELDDTAAVLGANRWQRLRDVTLPRLAVPLAATGLVVAAFVIGAVEVPLLVGPTSPRMLGPYALDLVRVDGPAARADAAVAVLVATALTAIVGVTLTMMWRRLRR
ncbi:MAG: ABC transporter permease subunit [Acidimicrobiales bacterium]